MAGEGLGTEDNEEGYAQDGSEGDGAKGSQEMLLNTTGADDDGGDSVASKNAGVASATAGLLVAGLPTTSHNSWPSAMLGSPRLARRSPRPPRAPRPI